MPHPHQKLKALREKVRQLEDEFEEELAGLPLSYGYPNVPAFIEAVEEAVKRTLSRKRPGQRTSTRSRRR